MTATSPIALAGALVVALVGAARAVPAPQLMQLEPPRHASGEHRVTSESWHIDCGQLASTSRCRATLTMTLAGDVVLDVLDVWLGGLSEAPSATLDGAPLGLEAPLMNESGESYRRLVVPPGEHTLVLVVPLVLRHEPTRSFLVFPADEARHLVMHSGRPAGSYGFEVFGTRPAWRAEGYRASVEVVVDPALEWSPIGLGAPWVADGGVRRVDITPPADADESLAESGRDASRLVRFVDPGELVHFGGPMLGLGARIRGEATWFALRLEIEIALAEFILPGLSLDYAGDGLVFTPRVEISSPQIAIIPSFWAGVGLPLRLSTDPDPGLRLMVGVAFGPVGGLISVDLRPGSGADGGLDHELTALLRVSL